MIFLDQTHYSRGYTSDISQGFPTEVSSDIQVVSVTIIAAFGKRRVHQIAEE